MKITILSGGLSSERNAALCGSSYVAESLRSLGYEVALIDMYMGLEDYNCTSPEELFEMPFPQKWKEIAPEIPDLSLLKRNRKSKTRSVLGVGVLELLKISDAVFINFGGDFGEDGRIQGMLDIMGIPYTGSGHVGSAIAMDKLITKSLVTQNNIATPKWIQLNGREEIEKNKDNILLPCVIKNPIGGSSIGTYICKTKKDLSNAFEECLKMTNTILVEEFIRGREFSCAILEDEALPSIEILTDNHNYQNKYCTNVKEICPANISPDLENHIQSISLKVHKLLNLSSYSRSDFILTETGELLFLECNVSPGLTPKSLLPQEAKAAGIEYKQLCETMLKSAFNKI